MLGFPGGVGWIPKEDQKPGEIQTHEHAQALYLLPSQQSAPVSKHTLY